eukprot:TRINITY_DN8612_c1_g1_i1.p1 TRINITY_DN8612_c1_g1~~TRINITY_DN8612_c1_g1_i1.p1  ORF type:complete len:551 (-),score=64.17 TRINITY_DN8612_c1_g1_i1:27-1505(-)
MGLPLVMTELQSIKVVLRHLHPDSVDIAPMAGLLSLGLVVQTLEQRLAAVKDLVGGGERARQHRRTELPATAEVLTNNELLASILSYAGAGEFLFIAPVSKRVRALYTALVASTRAIASVHSTECKAAMRSQSRLQIALASAGFADALPSLSDTKQVGLCVALGELGSAELVEHMQLAGCNVSADVLLGAAKTCNATCLHDIWAGPLGRCELDVEDCFDIGIQLAESGGDGLAFSWLVPRLPKDESWPARYINALCNAAAQWGRTSTLDFLLKRGQQLFGALGTASLDDDEVRRASWALMCFDVEGTEHVRTLTDAAATAYSVAVLQWLQSRHALEFTGMTMLMAASNAALPNMKWLRAQGCPHDINEVCIMLMRVGGTEPLLDWVRSCGGGDWSPQGMARLLRSALSNDTPGLARWLRAEGARWPEDLVTIEIEEVKPSMIMWAVQQGCPFGRWTTEVCDALVRSHPDGAAVKRTLHDLGCPCACPRPYKL